MINRLLCIFTLLVSLGQMLGCSSQSDRPATYPVRGSISYQGKPVADAAVAFLADGAPRPAVAVTDAAGDFSLTTYSQNDGAVLGSHLVTVRKVTNDGRPPAPVADKSQPVDSAAIDQAMMQSAIAAKRAKSELPTKYADRKTSDLRREVVAGDNVFDIELTD